MHNVINFFKQTITTTTPKCSVLLELGTASQLTRGGGDSDWEMAGRSYT